MARGRPFVATVATKTLLLWLCDAWVRSADASPSSSPGEVWEDWLVDFGHDSWRYPDWVAAQRETCSCEVVPATTGPTSVKCLDAGVPVEWHRAQDLTWCVAMHFTLGHMPAFDLHFLPPSVTLQGRSMLDDNIAFALMAWEASSLMPKPPIKVAIMYLLPYATYHESRANWRPLFFAKFFALAANIYTTERVVASLISNNVQIMSWTSHVWKDFPGQSPSNTYQLGPFAGGTAPPALAPFDVVAFGYASCTGWSKVLSSALRAVGVPAREVGSPCWNTEDFQGLASQNPNVTSCWAGGKPNGPSGGAFLNDHTWVEYWDNEAGAWRFVDSVSSSTSEDTWFCHNRSETTGCSCSSPAGMAGPDHWILAPSWSPVGSDEDFEEANGGEVIDVAEALVLSTGQHVSPLVWASNLTSPLGVPLKNIGLRVVNRTFYYKCRGDVVDINIVPDVVDDVVAANALLT